MHIEIDIELPGASVLRCSHGRPLGGNPCPDCPCTRQRGDPDGPVYPEHNKFIGRRASLSLGLERGWFGTWCTRCDSMIRGTPICSQYDDAAELWKQRLFQSHSVNQELYLATRC